MAVPSDMILFGDNFKVSKPVGFRATAVLSPTRESFSPSRRHNEGANIVFCDGHVEYTKITKWIERSDTAVRRWNPDNEPHPETWSGLETVGYTEGPY